MIKLQKINEKRKRNRNSLLIGFSLFWTARDFDKVNKGCVKKI